MGVSPKSDLRSAADSNFFAAEVGTEGRWKKTPEGEMIYEEGAGKGHSYVGCQLLASG
jgi:hypothetical protein